MIDRLHRLFLRVAHRIHRACPELLRRRRRRQAALVAVWSRGELLLVRHSYRPGFMLPGGGARRSETLEQAACRELEEEVGIHADPESLVPAYTTITVRVFEYHPVARPRVAIDNREIVEARFADPREVDLAAYVESYLLSRPFPTPT